MDKTRLRPVATTALFVASLAVSIALLDASFRAYENRFLIHRADPNAERYALRDYGYNDHEDFVAKRKGPREFRILSFGDSFAHSPTKAPYSYASVLQLTLSDHLVGRTARVVNFGRGLTSFPDYISQYRIWSRKLEYDGVLFNIFAGNDFKESNGSLFLSDELDRYRPIAPGQSLRFGPGVAIPHQYPLRVLDYAVAWFLSFRHGRVETDFYHDSAHASQKKYLKTQVKQARAYRLDAVGEFADSHYWLFKLLALAERVRESKLSAVTIAPPHSIVSATWMQRVIAATGSDGQDRFDPALPGIVVRELAALAGYKGPIIDLTACLRAAASDGEDLYYGTNTHWSVRGNEIVGQILLASLLADWFDGTQGDRSRAYDCDTSPARATGTIARVLDSNFAAFPDLLEFENGAMASLLELSFDSIEEVFRTLSRLGYRRSDRIGGAFLVQPAYLIAMTHLTGWVTNESAPDDRAFIVFFREGKLQSVGRTLPRETDSSSQLRFRSRMRGKSLQIGRDGDLWAVAITDAGLFAPLILRERIARSE